MPAIIIETRIKASVEICFDLSRSIDLHKISTADTNEEAVAGVTNGLLGMGQSVTWEATHFGVRQQLTSKITSFHRPYTFTDEMEKGAFKRFSHKHIFKKVDQNESCMIDVFDYQSPLGILGRLADWLFLKSYMKNLLIKRNQVIKEFAENGSYKELLS